MNHNHLGDMTVIPYILDFIARDSGIVSKFGFGNL